VTISGDNPFLTAEAERSPVRRLRGRLPLPVTLWTAGTVPSAVGLTVASALVVDGEPGHVLGVLDPESDLCGALRRNGLAVVTLLRSSDRRLADAFGFVAPAPGGPFTVGSWEATPWGPRFAAPRTWAGIRLTDARPVGYALLVDAVIEHIELEPAADDPLTLYHARYR
jgi:flavin reductase (DIM6/NTAB) family NADH-FMN oxidoreductase RutF